MVPKILVVDDSQVILLTVKDVLTEAGYEVWTAVSGEEALTMIQRKGLPYLAIVDINMPLGMNGFEFCQEVHKYSLLPIIMLSSTEEEETVVKGLDLYADDYIVKPANGPLRAQELVSRVRRLLRRIGDFAYVQGRLTRVDQRLQIDFPNRQATVNGRSISLTPTEARLLYILIHYAGRTLTNDYLLRRLWPIEEAYEERLHTHVYRLRKKIETNPKKPHYIMSEWGKGYLFLAPQ